MTASYWRDRARPVIAEVLRATAGKSEAEIRKALRDAYPFGPREHHPYKIWLDEIRRQRGGESAAVKAKRAEIEEYKRRLREGGCA